MMIKNIVFLFIFFMFFMSLTGKDKTIVDNPSNTRQKVIYMQKLIHWVKQGNKEMLSKCIIYPLERGYPLPPVWDEKDFIDRFDEIFDRNFRDKIARSSICKDWSVVGWRGTMFDSGLLWLPRFDVYSTSLPTSKDKLQALKIPPIETIENSSIGELAQVGTINYHSSVEERKKDLLLNRQKFGIFKNINSEACYYLTGDDYALSDKESSVLAIDIAKLKGTGGNNIKWRIFDRIPASDQFIVCVDFIGCGTSCYLLLKQKKFPYYKNKPETADALFCHAIFTRNTLSKANIRKLEELLSQKTEEAKFKTQLCDIHPYAFYLLSCEKILEINTTKFYLNNSNEVSGKIPYRKGNRFGFIEKGENCNFYFQIHKQLAPTFSIIKCVFQKADHTPETSYILVRRYFRYYHDGTNFRHLEVLRRCGDFGSQAPTGTVIENFKANLKNL